MMKPALEKFMKDSGFVKKDVLDKLEKRVSELERSVKDLNNRSLIIQLYQLFI